MTQEDNSSFLNPVGADRTLGERLFLIWDLAIVVLVCLNLALIAFDMLFSVTALAGALKAVAPAAQHWYAHVIHANFLAIDLGFVIIFLADVLLGWAVALVQRRHYRWYFYPFIHWYDVLGCIPIGGFRLLRVLRLISILIRLQHLGIIDVRNWAIYRNIMVYYDIFVEEISDRVVINVLSGMQKEIASGGSDLATRVVREVVQPRQEQMVSAASSRIEQAVIQTWQNNQDEIRAYIASLVHSAVRGNRALNSLDRVPKLGGFVTGTLDQTITDTIHDALDGAVNGLESADFDNLVQHITDTVMSQMLDAGVGEPSELSGALVEVLDLVKKQVAVQQWRSHFE